MITLAQKLRENNDQCKLDELKVIKEHLTATLVKCSKLGATSTLYSSSKNQDIEEWLKKQGFESVFNERSQVECDCHAFDSCHCNSPSHYVISW